MPKDYLKNPPLAEDEMMAAIDIGSNSFHLAIARLDHGEVRKVVSMSERVQLAAGLDENDILGAAAEKRRYVPISAEGGAGSVRRST